MCLININTSNNKKYKNTNTHIKKLLLSTTELYSLSSGGGDDDGWMDGWMDRIFNRRVYYCARRNERVRQVFCFYRNNNV